MDNFAHTQIAQLKQIHQHQYDYSKAVYTTTSANITITCPKHGDFEKTYATHKQGSGCPSCAKLRPRQQRMKNKTTFIDQANKRHNHKYSYEKAIYQGSKEKVIITCQEHGDFTQRPTDHINGHGCPSCKSASLSSIFSHSAKRFIDKATTLHHGKYDYSKVDYRNNRTKVIITCPEHGDFIQTPDKHTNSKRGCPTCGGSSMKTHNAFIKEAHIKHNNKYTYPDTYKRAHDKITVTCPIHGNFDTTGAAHSVTGRGCPSCSSGGFKQDKPGLLYYILIEHEGKKHYKIGITNNSVYNRFIRTPMLNNITVLKTIKFTDGKACYQAEQQILKAFKHLKSNITKNDFFTTGYSEIFDVDILNLHHIKQAA